ncbi:peptidase S28 [Peniophora sp. CONT]|nr:peptidase S28 [Peniophora sp. CONT]
MLSSFVAPLLLALSAAARLEPPKPLPPLPPAEGGLHALAYKSGYFKQLIDHTNPSLGTFNMRYWVDSTFYKAGGPIIMFTPGEDAADGFTSYLSNTTLNGQIAQKLNGATVLIEHRYFGDSNPNYELTVDSLQHLTVQQAIDDLAYFAQTVTLPFTGGDAVKPDTTPWILVGGSYSGALAAYAVANQPDVFWAGYSSSGVVQGIVDFYDYFKPIQENMPKNCSSDVAAVIAHFDSVANNATAFNALKAQFGLSDVSAQSDVTGALRYNLWDWQSLQPYSGPNQQFFQFCDALEVDGGKVAPATGFGLDHALEAWGSYLTNTYLPMICGHDDMETCLGTPPPDSEYYTNDYTPNSARSWSWMTCNQFGFFQDSPPTGQTTLVSRLVQPSADETKCQWTFPAAFSSPPVPNVQQTNSMYGGWDMKVDRVFFAAGSRDPWRAATMGAEGVTPPNIDPSNIGLSDGFHCSDLLTQAGTVDSSVLAVQQAGLTKISQWVKEFVPASKRRSVERDYAYPVRRA